MNLKRHSPYEVLAKLCADIKNGTATVKAVKEIIDTYPKFATLTDASSDGRNLVHVAAIYNNVDILQLVLEGHAKKYVDVDAPDMHGNTALLSITQDIMKPKGSGNKKLARLLFTRGSPDASYKRVIRLLLKHGANPNYKSGSPDHEMTPLGALVFNHVEDPEYYKMLIDAGADPCITFMKDGFTPLHLAVDYFHDPKCKVLPLLIRECNLNKVTSAGFSPLYIAVTSCNPLAIKYLLERGALVSDAKSFYDIMGHTVKNKLPRSKETVISFVNAFQPKNWTGGQYKVAKGETVIYDHEMMDIDDIKNGRQYFYNVRETRKDGTITTLYDKALFPPKLTKSPITRKPWYDHTHLKTYTNVFPEPPAWVRGVSR